MIWIIQKRTLLTDIKCKNWPKKITKTTNDIVETKYNKIIYFMIYIYVHVYDIDL